MRKKLKIIMFAVSFLLFCSGFASNKISSGIALHKMNKMKPNKNQHYNSLGVYFRQMANDEAVNHNWNAAEYFALKSINAFNGNKVKPYNPNKWVFSDIVALQELIDARHKLVFYYNKFSQKYPTILAKMVAKYDCWGVRQQYNDYIPIAMKCRNDFLRLMHSIDGKVSDFDINYINTIEYILMKDINADVTYRLSIMFPWKKHYIRHGEMKQIDKIIDYIGTRGGDYFVVLFGHTDQVGTYEDNRSLSEKRANAVKEILINRGVPKEKIKIYSMSEYMPVVDAEEKRLQVNRRVEVYVVSIEYMKSK